MQFLAHALDDPDPRPCGKCASCLGGPIVDPSFRNATAVSATRFLRQSEIDLNCKRQVAGDAFVQYGFRGNLPAELRAETGRILSRWGDKTLLDRRGIAVVGSRDASEDDLAFTERLGSGAARQGLAVVSGGARGVDQRAMLGALENEGVALGVLADSLLRSVASARYRRHVASGCLVLISPFNPEARFNVGNAMNRNRYIYCLSDAAVVIGCKTGKGGTWSGAIEDLEAGWVPLWVKRSPDAGSGNPELVVRGARWLPEELGSLGCLAKGDQASLRREGQAHDLPPPEEIQPSTSTTTEARPSASPMAGNGRPAADLRNEKAPRPSLATPAIPESLGFYELFLVRLAALASEAPLRLDEICERLGDVEKSQVRKWLQRGVSDGEIEKLTRPVRYRRRKVEEAQGSLPLGAVD